MLKEGFLKEIKMKDDQGNIFVKCVIYCLLVIIVKEIARHVFYQDELMYDSFGEKIAYQEMLYCLPFIRHWCWHNYFLISAFLFIKLIVITVVLYFGIRVLNNKIRFKELLDSVLNAEFMFLLVPFVKIVCFYFFYNSHGFMEEKYFYPLSGLIFFDLQTLKISLIYPLQLINLFESSYVLFLGFQIGNLTGTDFDKGLGMVCCIYLPLLLLWSVLVILKLNFL